MKFLCALFIASCTPVIPTPPPEVVVAKPLLEDLLNTEASAWPTTGWVEDYSFTVQETLKIAPIAKLPCKDGAAVFKSIAKAESGFKRETVYREPAPLNNNSIGLLQLSFTDQKNYGIYCKWANEEDLKHPIRNLYCGVRMLSILEKKNPTLNFYQYGGKYWSVLRALEFWPGKSQSGYERFKASLKLECKD
jgi:Transglycosylase SLT domain